MWSCLTRSGGDQTDVDGRRERVWCPAVPTRLECFGSPLNKTSPKRRYAGRDYLQAAPPLPTVQPGGLTLR